MIMHHHQHQQQQQQQQFLTTNLCPNSRPHNDDSTTPPSDSNSSNPNSMSTATPPHSGQICQMRVSPASTTLMASSNNINGIAQPSSRQLSPQSNNGGTNGSGSSNSNGQQQHTNHSEGPTATNQHHQSSRQAVRQFACHAKSMSAGVVVSVPGISNHLATANGMNQNNVINSHIAATHQHSKQHNQGQQVAPGAGMAPSHPHVSNGSPFIHPHQHPHPHPHPHTHQHQSSHISNTSHAHRSSHHQSSSSGGQQQIFTRPRERNHHRQQLSQPNSNYHQPSATLLHPHHQHSSISTNTNTINNSNSHHSSLQNGGGSSSNFLNNMTDLPQVSRRTSIIPPPMGKTIMHPQSHHNRSSSAQLTSVPLIGGHNNHHTQSNHHMSSIAGSTTAVASVRHHTNHHQNYTNSIWSVDEHMSKSQNKLASSGYLAGQHHPYLYNPSITDMSCDNVSQGSRLPDGAPAPGYYHPHGSGGVGQNAGGAGNGGNLLANSNGLSVSGSVLKGPEFLPICDLMFNLISMIMYFCENTFGVIALIALYYHSSQRHWALIGALFVVSSNAVSQYLSFKWLFKAKLEDCKRKREAQEELETEGDCDRRYFNRTATNMSDYPCGSCAWLPDSATEVQLKFLISITIDAILHLFCLGFLVRYIKLVIPVKASVHKETRDLCMLRMVHGFTQSAPLLLLQAYMICLPNNGATPVLSLSVTSATLSLINVCWALASFTKYARKKYLRRFRSILTWQGILSQLMWRLGMVSSRVVALTIYGVYYNYWMLVVLALHWLTMFLWLMKPGQLLRDEAGLSKPRKISFAAAIAWIYCFCYLNFEEHNSKLKMTSFYLIMFLENNLLLTVCLIFSSQVTWIKNLSILVVYLGFVFGMLFMFIYYKYFHFNVLNDRHSCSQESVSSVANQLSPAAKKIAGFEPGTIRLKSEECIPSSVTHLKYDPNHNIGANIDIGVCHRS